MAEVFSRIHHVGVVVQDLKASVAWYEKYLGFEHEYDFVLPGAQVTMLVRGDAHLELYQVEDAPPVARERLEVDTILRAGGINHVAFLVEDLEAAVAELAAAGVEVAIAPTNVPNESGDCFAFIRDNERMLVELVQQAR